MDTKKILDLLNECIKILGVPLVETDRIKSAHAQEFILILVGERINEVVNEIEKYVLPNKDFLGKLLASCEVVFDPEKLKNNDYCRQHFRAALNKNKLGNGLMLLHQLRDNLKHEFIHMTDEDHGICASLHLMVTIEVVPFLVNACTYIGTRQNSHEKLIEDLLISKDITLQNQQQKETSLVEAKLLNQLSTKLKDLKKSKTNKSQSNLRIQLVNKRIEHILEHEKLLEIYLEKFKHVKGMKKNEVHYYACLMILTAIGEDCTKLITYRKDRKKIFDEEIKTILNKHNGLLARLSHFATEFTHHFTTLPSISDARTTCARVIGSGKEFRQLAQEISEIKLPVSTPSSPLPHSADLPEEDLPPKKTKKEIPEEKHKEKKAKMTPAPLSLASLATKAPGSPIHTKPEKETKVAKNEKTFEDIESEEESSLEIETPEPKKKQEEQSKKRKHS